MVIESNLSVFAPLMLLFLAYFFIATGVYHLPILTFFHEKGYFISVINPFAMKKYAKNNNIRGAKTDKLDSITIANYGIEKWFKIKKYEGDEETYAELKILGRRYRFYMELHIKALQELTHILDYTMPGIKKMFNSWAESNGKDKLSDFVVRFWPFSACASFPTGNHFFSPFNLSVPDAA